MVLLQEDQKDQFLVHSPRVQISYQGNLPRDLAAVLLMLLDYHYLKSRLRVLIAIAFGG